MVCAYFRVGHQPATAAAEWNLLEGLYLPSNGIDTSRLGVYCEFSVDQSMDSLLIDQQTLC